jgi:hypothetical protein
MLYFYSAISICSMAQMLNRSSVRSSVVRSFVRRSSVRQSFVRSFVSRSFVSRSFRFIYLFVDIFYSSKDYKSSRLFGALPPEMVKFMATNLKSWHNHNKAVLPTVC